MKRNLYTVIICACLAAMTACESREKNSDIVVRKVQQKQNKTIQRVGDYTQSRVVDWNGNPFTVYVERKADTTKPIITDETGNKYYDNRVVVRITAKDGRDVFSQTFSKETFSNYVESTYLHDNALLGVVFDCVDGNSLCFAASIGSPDNMSDDYVPLLLKVSYGTYKITISKDTMREIEDQKNADDELRQAEEEGV